MGLSLGFKIVGFCRTGSVEQQSKELKSVIKFFCGVGYNMWLRDVTTMFLDESWLAKYDPCPFYVRY